MFRVTPVGARACAAALLFAGCAVVSAQSSSSSQTEPAPAADQTQAPATSVPATPASATQAPAAQYPGAPPRGRTPGYVPPQRSRRVNANRQARIARNIQDAYSHRWEIGGGGGYVRFHPGPQLLRINEVNFWVNGTRMWSPRWGVVGDVRGNYGNAKIPNQFAQNLIYRPQISHYNFMGGVQYRFLGTEKYAVSFQGEGGVTLSKFGGDAKGLPSQTLGLWKDSDYNPTFSGSIDLDYNLYNNFAVRVQPTYVGTTFGSTVQNTFGVNAGVVYRFGRQ